MSPTLIVTLSGLAVPLAKVMVKVFNPGVGTGLPVGVAVSLVLVCGEPVVEDVGLVVGVRVTVSAGLCVGEMTNDSPFGATAGLWLNQKTAPPRTTTTKIISPIFIL